MYRNSEHYPDPTFAEAYSNINAEERGNNYITWVYIASPYRGSAEKNIIKAKSYALFAVKRNKMPICPHIYFTQFLDDNNVYERKKGLSLALQMLKRCKEMWVFSDIISQGMEKEIKAAKRWNIHIRYFTTDMEEVSKQ